MERGEAIAGLVMLGLAGIIGYLAWSGKLEDILKPKPKSNISVKITDVIVQR